MNESFTIFVMGVVIGAVSTLKVQEFFRSRELKEKQRERDKQSIPISASLNEASPARADNGSRHTTTYSWDGKVFRMERDGVPFHLDSEIVSEIKRIAKADDRAAAIYMLKKNHKFDFSEAEIIVNSILG